MSAVEKNRHPHRHATAGRLRSAVVRPQRFYSSHLQREGWTRDFRRHPNAHFLKGFRDREQGMPKKNERRSQGEDGIA